MKVEYCKKTKQKKKNRKNSLILPSKHCTSLIFFEKQYKKYMRMSSAVAVIEALKVNCSAKKL